MAQARHHRGGQGGWVLGGLLALGATIALDGCKPEPARVRFAPYQADYQGKPDFARLERQLPLTRAELVSLTPANMAKMTQEQLDQIYARLTAGPIPDGAYQGGIIFAAEGGLKRIGEILGGVKGLGVKLAAAKLDFLGEVVWKGKLFDRDQRVLRNIIRDKQALQTVLGIEPEGLSTTRFQGKTAWLLFPARLYCGQSLLDGRRESIIIDYAYTDQLPGYLAKLDRLVGREGLAIRDEIRMVRPGFYLGRAYLNRVFGVNFTLYNKELAEAGRADFLASGRVAEDCWTGEQKRHADAT